MTKLDEFASRYPDIYEFLVELDGKADTPACNCDSDFDGEVWRNYICPLHKAEKLLEDLEKEK